MRGNLSTDQIPVELANGGSPLQKKLSMNPTEILNATKAKGMKRVVGGHSKVQISKRLQQIINGGGTNNGGDDDNLM
jgi:hypothetical protein